MPIALSLSSGQQLNNDEFSDNDQMGKVREYRQTMTANSPVDRMAIEMRRKNGFKTNDAH